MLEMVSRKLFIDLAIILLTTLVFIFLLNVTEYFLLLAEIPYAFMTILLFPFAEELYKYFYAIKMRERAFLAILIFAIFEILVVKIPLMYISYNGESGLFFLVPITAFIFHILTAFNYTSNQFFQKPRAIFSIMLALHCLFNYVSYLIVDTSTFLICSMLVSLTPYFWLILSKKIIR